MLSVEDLHRYQHHAIEFGCRHKRCALFLGLGLGKTIIALSIAAIQLWTGSVHRVLVIAPLRVANTVWKAEAARWWQTQGLSVALCTGTAVQRLGALRSDADIHVINVDNVPWLVEQFPRSRWRWDMVIIDESSGFKSPSTVRFKRLRTAVTDKIRTIRGRRRLLRSAVERILLLSATPATSGLEGLWSQLMLIDSGQRLGVSFAAFQNQYFQAANGGLYNRKIFPREGAKEKLFDRVRDVCYVLDAAEHLDMPELVVNTIELEMPVAAMAKYRELQREFLIHIDEEEVYAPNEAALANKLLQLANGAVYTGETPKRRVANRPWRALHSVKLDALEELAQAAQGAQNLLVAYHYQSDRQRLVQRFPHAAVLDQAGSQVEPWNAGQIPMLLVNPASAAKGLNLQHGGSTCVFYSLTWSLENYLQFIGRLYRQGQRHGVTVNHLVCKGTIEHAILNALRGNARTQQEFLDALKREVTSHLVAA